MKQNLNIMKTYNITNEIYSEMAERAAKYVSCYWDCIELEDGFAVIFALDNGKPYDVEVRNEDDEVIASNFNISDFEKVAIEEDAICYDLFGKAWICGSRVNA